MNTVIFDIGNVLAAWDWQGYLSSFGYEEAVTSTLAEAIFLSKDWVLADRGMIDETKWLQCFIKNAPEYEREIKAVYQTLGKCIRPYNYTLDWIAYYRASGYRIYYLSNYSSGLYAKTKEQLSFIEDMDGGIFSFEEKCIKPDLRIYKLLLNRYNIEPEDAIFYDDRLENIEAARQLGLHAELFMPDIVNRDLQ